MSILIEYKYAGLISNRLERCKQIRSNLWNARCPICGDSKKHKNKKRFYIYVNRKGAEEHLCVQCHNCTYSKSFYNFLKDFDPYVFNEFRVEMFKERGYSQNTAKEEDLITDPTPSNTKESALDLPTISDLDDGHIAKIYVRQRKIPPWAEDYLMFSENFRVDFCDFTDTVEMFRLPDDPRLVIPFYNDYGNLNAVQGRSFNPDTFLRYITIKKTESSSKIFGLDRVNRSRTVIVVEGPIDSLFLPNCIATADGNLLSAGFGDIFIPDFQYRNKAVCDNIERIIAANKKLVLFPDSFTHKDINDAVKNGGLTTHDLLKLITDNLYQGVRAKLKFSQLRKC